MIVLDGDEYLTVDEASALLGVKRATLYAYVSRGILRSYRQGIRRQRLYRRLDLERFQRVAPSGAGGPLPEASRTRPPAAEIPFAESWIQD